MVADFRFVGKERDVNLHTVNNHRRFLRKVVREYRMVSGDVVVYNGKSGDRYRMVVMMGTVPVMVMPETDLDHRISRFIKQNDDLREMNFASKSGKHKREMEAFFDDSIQFSRARLARQRKARAARKRRGY